MNDPEQIGLEVLYNQKSLAKDWGRCSLLCNQASVAKNYRSSVSLLKEVFDQRLAHIMAPQHGYWSTEQDNMIETPHDNWSDSSLKIYSLYSETRTPSSIMLSTIDTIIIDLQIVGCRVYTFKWTLFNCLHAAQKHNKKIVVLDRPNPLGGKLIEGSCLDLKLSSFVGMYPLPMRHALTIGELANLFNQDIGADLTVIPMKHWDFNKYWNRNRPWVPTSPNLPTLDSVAVYPGMVLFEGTNVSEGRGTTLPFQLIGAPYLKDSSALIKRVKDYLPRLSGVCLQATSFRPMFGKWSGKTCNGVALRVIDREEVKSYLLGVTLLKSIMDLSENNFEWKPPPYEYDHKNLPIKLIVGSEEISEHLENFVQDNPYWSRGSSRYQKKTEDTLLYPRDREVV